MSRPLRIEYEDAVYHVINRGRGRQLIFHGHDYYEAFLICLEEANRRFGLQVLCYCLMGNHYHLLLQTPQANLGRCMRHINGQYTQRYNRLKRTDGPLFRGRYKAILIDADSYLLQVSRYIHRNPIETKKPLVKRLEDYPWSSYRYCIRQAKAPEWLSLDAIRAATNSPRPYQAYQAYVAKGTDEQTEQFYVRKALPGIWGGKQFIQNAYEKGEIESAEISIRQAVERPSIGQVISQVAETFQCHETDIRVTARGKGMKNMARWVAMYLSQEVCGETLPNIAKEFNVGHYSTVSQTIRRLKEQIVDDNKLRKRVNMLSQDLTP
ncbi:MAG: transposase [Gammaproteobacteria bacterium]